MNAKMKEKPDGESKYARKKRARRTFLKKGGTLGEWMKGRRSGTIKI